MNSIIARMLRRLPAKAVTYQLNKSKIDDRISNGDPQSTSSASFFHIFHTRCMRFHLFFHILAMADEPSIHLKQSEPPPKRHPEPDLKNSIKTPLTYSYKSSPDGIDSNLLIFFHGLGDTYKPFGNLADSLNLPQTATLSLQAPSRVPLLEEEAYQWWPSFDELGNVITRPDPTKTLSVLLELLNYLMSSSKPTDPAWKASSIHLFGFAQGGSCAAELCLLYHRNNASSPLGSLITVSAPLLSHPTGSLSKSPTSVLAVLRRGEERMVQVPSYRKGFEIVHEMVLPIGVGMAKGRAEWEGIMKFWSQMLGKRSAFEFGKDVYEVMP